MSELPFRILPLVTDTNRHFWASGADGQLRFLSCDDCGYLIHPPAPICPRDLSKKLSPRAVSGNATVATFTINHQPWMPGPDLPYVVAIVEIDEQPSNTRRRRPRLMRSNSKPNTSRWYKNRSAVSGAKIASTR